MLVPDLGTGCPALVVLGVQGTSESSPAADPRALTGMIGQVFAPMLGSDPGIGAFTIPYDASFGGVWGTGADTTTFAASSTRAEDRLGAAAARVVAECPHTQLGVVGFSQGAGAAAGFARAVGDGIGPVDADHVAGVALLSDWTRSPGGQIPGRPGQTTPDPAPGTAGTEVSGISLPPVPSTGGIVSDAADFGDLSGRVGQYCAAGDLACDFPDHAAVVQAVAGIAAQADLGDPVSAVSSLTAVATATAARAGTAAILDDVQLGADGSVDYVPAESFCRRLADAADPRDPGPAPEAETRAASDKAAQVAAAIAADPLGQIPRLVGELGAAVAANIADNADLADPAVLSRAAGVVADHTGYGRDGTAAAAGDWFDAIAHDLEGDGR